MHQDLEKLLQLGKIKPNQASSLDFFSPGRYLLHGNWGVGKVRAWSLANKKLLIDFESNSNQQMDLQLAMQKLKPLPASHYLVKHYEDPEQSSDLAFSQPLAFLKSVLSSNPEGIKESRLRQEICPRIISEDDYKKWMTNLKKELESGSGVRISKDKDSMFSLFDSNLSATQLLLEDYSCANPKDKLKVLDNFSKSKQTLGNEAALGQLVESIDKDLFILERTALGDALEIAAMRDLLLEAAGLSGKHTPKIPLSDIIKRQHKHFHEVIGNCAAVRMDYIMQQLPEALGKNWVLEALLVFDKGSEQAVRKAANLLLAQNREQSLLEHLQKALNRHNLGLEGLLWLLNCAEGFGKELLNVELTRMIMSTFERDLQQDGPSKTNRLKKKLLEEPQILVSALGNSDEQNQRSFMRSLCNLASFNKQEQAQLLGALEVLGSWVEEFSRPEQSTRKTLYVSAESLQRKQEELQHLVKVAIPQNVKDIAVAREYGDLRENFEYKAAKDEQRRLNQLQKKITRELEVAEICDFKDGGGKLVKIGSVVTLQDENGKQFAYTILGAWDSDPERKILSYLSEVGAQLLGSKLQQQIKLTLPGNDAMKPYLIVAIKSFNT